MTSTSPVQSFELDTLLPSTNGTLAEVSIENVFKAASEPAVQRSKFKGWRFGLVCGTVLVFLVLVVNTSVLIWACIKFEIENSIVTIATESCEEM